VIANNTEQEGMFFKNVVVTQKRQGFTSSVSINPIKQAYAKTSVYGLYFAKDSKPLTGVKFEGKTVRQGKEFKIYLCTIGARIEADGVVWRLDEFSGWVACGHWEMQILVPGKKDMECVSVRPSGGCPVYKYETEKEARDLLDMCYSDSLHERKRVLFVAEENK
jgi:hypothetical protein